MRGGSLMRYKLLVCLIAAILLSGCSVDTKATEKQVAEVASPNIQIDNSSQKVWDLFTERNGVSVEGLLGLPQEPDLFPLYLEGLKHSSPLVRWYSANQLIEYAYEDNKNIIIEGLEKLQNDSDEKVRTAAAFALSAITKSFEGDRFKKTTDGKKVAFYKYDEAIYNDGIIYLYIDDSQDAWYEYDIDGSITDLTWAPDGNKLCVEYGGRSWSFVSLVDLNNSQVVDVGLISHIMKNHEKLGYKLVENPRSDPRVTLLEWSPKSDRILLFYSFTDDDLKLQSGTAIYNVSKDNFESIKPYPEEADEGVEPRKPEDFTWSN